MIKFNPPQLYGVLVKARVDISTRRASIVIAYYMDKRTRICGKYNAVWTQQRKKARAYNLTSVHAVEAE